MDKQFYKKYVNETVDPDGRLTAIEYNIPDNFNFGFDIVDEWGRIAPDKKAMIWISSDDKERIFTFGDMMKLSSQAANYFVSLGIKKGDRVMLILRRHYQFWISIVALHKIGAIVIPATDQLMKKDLVYRFKAAGVSAVCCSAASHIIGEVELAEKEYDGLKVKCIVEGVKDGWSDFDGELKKFSDVFARPEGEDATNKNDLMLMYFTSGTTGYPKIAAHDFTYAMAHYTTAKWWHNVDVNGIHFTVAETGWGKAVWGKLYGQWILGACVFTYDFEKFDANKVLEMIEKYSITTFCAPPTIYRFFIKEDLSKFNLSSLKYATIAGEALNPEVFKQFYAATGIKLMEGFGQTETTLTLANLLGMEPKPGSMGKPNPQYKVRLINGEGKDAVVGEEGEICLEISPRPVGLFAGYYLDKENTDLAMEGGMYHTGDMAWKDEDGYFWYVGRTDDLIKSSGYRIGPFEIESVIMEHPKVLECAVTGVPDPVRGQLVKATIVLVKGTDPSDELKKEIQQYVKVHTAPYKYPRVVEFVSELPKTISGKIRRVQIRKEDEKQ